MIPSDNDTWIIEAGDRIIQKKASVGIGGLSALEQLIYCIWVADYGMRNAGDLETARDLYEGFQVEATRLARELSLQFTFESFCLPTAALEHQYFDRFDGICDEIRTSAA